MIIRDTFEKQIRSLVRRVALLERRAGGRGGGSGIAQVVALERADRVVPTGVTSTLTAYADIFSSGDAMSAGSFSIAILKPGWYTASAAVRWGTNVSGQRQLRIMEGDTVIRAFVEAGPMTGTPGQGVSAQQVTSGPMYLTPANEPIRAMVYQSSGVSLAINNHSTDQWSTNYLRMNYLGEQG